jgi:hypothetical protein
MIKQNWKVIISLTLCAKKTKSNNSNSNLFGAKKTKKRAFIAYFTYFDMRFTHFERFF